MPRTVSANWFRRGVTVVLVTAMVSGCAPGTMTTQSQRIGPDDGSDSCRPQLVALDSTGNFFGAQILQGAAIGAGAGALAGGLIGGLATGNWRGAAFGAMAGGVTGGVIGGSTAYWSALQQQRMDQAQLYSQVSSDLMRENVAIDKTQLAFDQLTDCRFRQAAAINAAYAAHNIDRNTALMMMAQVRQHAQRDVALARMINQQIQERGQQFGVAAGNVDPGAAAAMAAPPQMAAEPGVVRTASTLKLRPDPTSPDVGQLPPQQPVTITGGRNGYAQVETPTGSRGYVPSGDLQGANRRSISVPTTAPPASSGGDVRTLAGSNAARRDEFSQSVAVTEKAEAGGFELAG